MKNKVVSLVSVFSHPAPWAFFAAGIAVIHWANVLPRFNWVGQWSGDVSDIAKSLNDFGKVLVGTSVATFIWKYLELRSYLQNAVSEVFFGDEFLSKQSTAWLEAHLTKTGVALQRKSLPEIADDVFRTVLENYTARDLDVESMDSYHKSSDRVITVDWHDEANGIVTVHSEMETVMVPRSSSNRITLGFSASVLRAKSDKFVPTVEYCHLRVNKSEVKLASILKSAEVDSEHIVETRIECRHIADGNQEYFVEVATQRTFALAADPVIHSRFTRFVAQPTIAIQCIPDNLHVTFIAMGTPLKFEDHTPKKKHPKRANDRYFSYPGLVFPGQGFALVISKC